jgi:hypothetical protein
MHEPSQDFRGLRQLFRKESAHERTCLSCWRSATVERVVPFGSICAGEYLSEAAD